MTGRVPSFQQIISTEYYHLIPMLMKQEIELEYIVQKPQPKKKKAPGKKPKKAVKYTKKNIFSDDDPKHLRKYRQRLELFVNSLGELKNRPINPHFFSYCCHKDGSFKNVGKVVNPKITPKEIFQILDCKLLRMSKYSKKPSGSWTGDDCILLLWILSKFCDLHHFSDPEKQFVNLKKMQSQKEWQAIALLIPGSQPSSCKFRWLNFRPIALASRKWTKEESVILNSILLDFGKKNQTEVLELRGRQWKQISQILYERNPDPHKVYRNPKLCKDHWNTQFSEEQRHQWTIEEDILMLELFLNYKGKRVWTDISPSIKGRSQNAIKNRYRLILKRLQSKTCNRDKPERQIIAEGLVKFTSELGSRRQAQQERQKQGISQDDFQDEKDHHLRIEEDSYCDYFIDNLKKEDKDQFFYEEENEQIPFKQEFQPEYIIYPFPEQKEDDVKLEEEIEAKPQQIYQQISEEELTIKEEEKEEPVDCPIQS